MPTRQQFYNVAPAMSTREQSISLYKSDQEEEEEEGNKSRIILKGVLLKLEPPIRPSSSSRPSSSAALRVQTP